MKLAEALYRQEKYALARTEFERLSTMYPTSEYADAALYFAGMSAMALSTAEGLNAAISTWDDLIQRGGPLAFAARQQQAIATLRQGNREKALKIYDTLLSTPDAKGEQRLSLQIEKAQLLIDLGRKEPKQREAAVALLREMLASERLSYTWSARCGVMLATTLRDLGRNSEALEACYDVINVGTNVISGPQNPTEYLWFYRAGFTAVDLLETAQQWEPAARIAERLAQTSGDRAKDAAERASKIRLKHFLWDGEK
jgi:tetratricopeptide (TPR) repeat protein